jgi:O-antigen ligase
LYIFVANFASHDAHRIYQVSIFILTSIFLLAAENKSSFNSLRLNKKCLYAGLILLATVSSFLSPHADSALRELSVVLGLVGVITTISQTNFKEQYKIIVTISACSASIYSGAIIMMMLLASISKASIQAAELFFGYDNFRFYNHVQTVCLPLLALATASKCCSTQVTRIAWIGLITGFALLMVSAGRATAIGIILSAILSLVFFKLNARTFVWHLLLAAIWGAWLNIMIIFIIPIMINGHPSDFEVQNTQEVRQLLTTSSRYYLWDLSLQYIKQHPWLGIGPMHFAHYPNAKAGHPHNIYLQIAAEWGIPMMLSCILIALRGLQQMLGAIRLCFDKSHQTIGIALFSACVAVMVDGGFSGNFVMPVSQMWIAVLIGLSISWTRSQQASAEHTTPSKIGIYLTRSFKVLLLVSQLWLIWSIYPEVIHLHDHLEQVKTQPPQNLPNAPRFWSFGWF